MVAHFRSFLLVVTAFILQFESYNASNNVTEPKGAHICERLTTFKTHEPVSYTTRILENYSYCCERFILCMRYCDSTRYRAVVNTKLVTKSHHKITKYCCEGWIQSGTECIPVCRPPCKNGKCIQPNFCVCADGYFGPQCQIEKQTDIKRNREPLRKQQINNNDNKKKVSSTTNSWSWIVPTIVFTSFVIAVFLYFKVKRESIYKGTILAEKLKVRYNSMDMKTDGKPLTFL